MPKKKTGTQLQALALQTINGDTANIPSGEHKFTHIQFRRFAGCPICDMHLQSFVAKAKLLETHGIQEVVFFHSSAAALLKYNAQLPFHVVADPNKKRYREFGVESSLLSVLHPQAMLQGMRGVLRKGLGLSLENGPLGLPADILLDASNTVIAAKYGTHAYDQWTLDELLQLCAADKTDSSPGSREPCLK